MISKYIKIKDKYDCVKVIDTTILIPHMECYLVENNNLFSESIDGIVSFLGTIISEGNTVTNMFDEQKEV